MFWNTHSFILMVVLPGSKKIFLQSKFVMQKKRVIVGFRNRFFIVFYNFYFIWLSVTQLIKRKKLIVFNRWWLYISSIIKCSLEIGFRNRFFNVFYNLYFIWLSVTQLIKRKKSIVFNRWWLYISISSIIKCSFFYRVFPGCTQSIY